MFQYIQDIVLTVTHTLHAQWLLLALGTMAAVIVQVYVDPKASRRFVARHDRLAIPSAIALAALTPLCACGTMGVILALFVTQMPWGPVMAFLVTSPLISPSGFLFSVSFLGLPFAAALLAVALLLGVVAGFGTSWLEKHTSLFQDQFRRPDESCTGSACAEGAPPKSPPDGFDIRPIRQRWKLDQLWPAIYRYGLRGILLYFVLFIAIGRTVELLVPTYVIRGLFSGENPASIPLAAILGMPLYLSGPAALPLLRSFVDQGAAWGAVLAFVITGQATGLPVLLGMGVFIRWRVLVVYGAFALLGALVAGYAFEALLLLGP